MLRTPPYGLPGGVLHLEEARKEVEDKDPGAFKTEARSCKRLSSTFPATFNLVYKKKIL